MSLYRRVGVRSKRTPCRYVNRQYSVAITLTHKLCRARARGVGAAQSLGRAACKPAVQTSNANRLEKRCEGGGAFNLCNPRPGDTQSFRTRRK